MPDARPLTAIVCDFDRWARQALREALEAQGFTVLAEAENAIEAIQLCQALHPSLVVISHEQPGISGLEAASDLLAAEAEVLLTSTDDSAREPAREAGAFDLVVKGDTDMLDRMLDEVRELLETGERRKSGDRRVGDRREHQDWSKVISERRSGSDRRGGLRREKDVTEKAKDIVAQRNPAPPGA